MPHTTRPVSFDQPKPTDPPFLIAILIGARKTGDRFTERLARGWLADVGIKVHFSSDSSVLSPPSRKGVARG